MRILDTSPATSSIGLPVKTGTLVFLQNAYQDIGSALMSQLVGNAYAINTIYVLSGCINTGAGTTLDISAGWLFVDIGDGGMVYYFAGVSFTPTNVGVSNFATAQFGTNADPVNFTNGDSFNIHNIITITVANGNSGTGNVTSTAASDYANWVRLGSPAGQAIVNSTFPSTWTEPFTQNYTQFFTTGMTGTNAYTITFNFANAIWGCWVRLKFAASAGCTLAIAAPSGCLLVNDAGTFTNSKTNMVYMEYMGINEAGNHEVSYTITNY